MAFRTVVIKNRAKLDYKMDYLVVRSEEEVKRIYLDEISILIVESTAVSLTAYLLAELVKKKIKVIFCNEQRNPVSELCSFYGSHNTSRKVREQIKWNEETKKFVWAEIIRAKISGQISNLPADMKSASEKMSSYLPEIKPGDETNREGHAAKIYFNALFGMSFSRSDENFINAALNYGYSIILSAFNREITANGYLTELGIAHDNLFNPFNLSCDFMEPFRPFVDREVLQMEHDKFDHEDKIRLVNVLNNMIKIDDKKQHLSNAIHIFTLSVIDALSENDISKIKFPTYEL